MPLIFLVENTLGGQNSCMLSFYRLPSYFVFCVPFSALFFLFLFVSGENLNSKGGEARETSVITSVVYSNAFILCKKTKGTGITSCIFINSISALRDEKF